MTSQINPNNIDGAYPVAGQSNNTQGFRDNFTNTKTNFQYAAAEITDLQNNAVLKSALSGTTLDNNLNDNLIYAVKLQDVSYTYVQNTATAGSITIDYSVGQYQYISTTGSISLAFSNFPIAGTAGSIDLAINITNTAYTLTLPAAVSLGTTGIQGLSSNVITFAATGTYQFRFFSADGGTTITVYDLNRPLSYFTNTVNVAATTAATTSTTGAVIVAGGIGIGGNVVTGSNVLASGGVTATGNITGGNVLTTAAYVTANVNGGNLLATSTITAVGNIVGGNLVTAGAGNVAGNIRLLSATAVPAGGTTGAGLRMSSTTNLGIFFGSGPPTLSAAQGSLYIRTDGSTTITRMYINTNGSTGWTNVVTSS